ncbi:hypothetical protein VKT23_016826 [Stygiomarasmius scandens]|uniref:RecA family profile 1 domain-containing protein n=1 Tax=Marasmiellus scandens TaxID=2682957 RepID=A0ABR1IVM9_9AGAR
MSRALSSLPLPPSTLSILKETGYETLEDLQSYESPDRLTESLKIPLAASQTLFSATQSRTTPAGSAPLTQSLSSIVSSRKRPSSVYPTKCPPVDRLLGGGLRRGHILEISGPPGSPKELISKQVVKSFINAGDGILWVDCRNGTNPSCLDELCQTSHHRPLVSYTKIHTLPNLMIFLHNLTNQLDSLPNVALIVIDSISFPFLSYPNLNKTAKPSVLGQIKQTFAKLCTNRNITVVTTSQLSTKLFKPDGTSGSFDTEGARGMMVGPLGGAYLPSGRSYRLLVALDAGDSGTIRLLSSPTTSKNSPQQIATEKFIILASPLHVCERLTHKIVLQQQDGTISALSNETRKQR